MKHLTLHKETLHNLTTAQTRLVAGGTLTDPSYNGPKCQTEHTCGGPGCGNVHPNTYQCPHYSQRPPCPPL